MPSTTLDNLFFVPPPLPPSSVSPTALGTGDQFGDALRHAGQSDQYDDDSTTNSLDPSAASLPPPCPKPNLTDQRYDLVCDDPSASASSTASQTTSSPASYPSQSSRRSTSYSQRRSDENTSGSSRTAPSSPTAGRRERSKSADSNSTHRQSNDSSTDSASHAPAANSQQASASEAPNASSAAEPTATGTNVQTTAANSIATLPGSVTGLTPDPIVATPNTGTPITGVPTAQTNSGNPYAIAVPQSQTILSSTPAAGSTANVNPSQQIQLAQALVTNSSSTDSSANPNPNAAPNPTAPDAQTQAAANPLAPAVANAIPAGAMALPVAGRTQITDTTQNISPDPNAQITIDRELIDQAIVTAVAAATDATSDAPSADQRQRRTDDSTNSQPDASNQPADVTRGAGNNDSQAAAANATARISTSSLNDKSATATPRGGPSQVDQARFVQRVARAFRAADEQGGQIRLRLSPPELGSLKLDIAIRNGQLTARLEAETTSARSLLLDNLPALRERLAGQNIKIERFDVDLKQDTAGNGSPNMPQDFAGSRQPSPRFQDSRPISSIVRTEDGPQTVTQSATTTDGRINIVI